MYVYMYMYECVLYVINFYIYMWQSQVENEYYSYHILTTFFEFVLL